MTSKSQLKRWGVQRKPLVMKNLIKAFFHCKKCIEEIPPNTSPREWAQLEVGWTRYGVQVWCKRHELEVEHFHLMGNKVRSVTYEENEIAE